MDFSKFEKFYVDSLKEDQENGRIDWDRYFLLIAGIVSMRSTCIRRKYGSVIVKDNRIVSTGYNGVATGEIHCSPNNCIREMNNLQHGVGYENSCNAVHSEMNAIISANPNDMIGSTLYLLGFDCKKNKFIPGIPYYVYSVIL